MAAPMNQSDKDELHGGEKNPGSSETIMTTSQAISSHPVGEMNNLLVDQPGTSICQSATEADLSTNRIDDGNILMSETIHDGLEKDEGQVLEIDTPDTADSNNATENCDIEMSNKESTKNCNEKIDSRTLMLNRIARSEAHFKHQQRGEPDLKEDEKLDIAAKVLDSNPVTFLLRFGNHLAEEDLHFFTTLQGSYEVDFYIKEIRRQLDVRKNKQKIRNRRYEAMQKLMVEGSYFSDTEMKGRDPLLYEQMIGQYLTEEEQQRDSVDPSEMRLSSMLMQFMEMKQNNAIRDLQQEREEGQMEESEEDDEEEEDKDEDDESEMEDESAEASKKDSWQPSAEEKSLLREEFLTTMQERFLSGQDLEFDYSSVDGNVEYDSLDIRQQDEEERYFDEEEPEDIGLDKDFHLDLDEEECFTSYRQFKHKQKKK